MSIWKRNARLGPRIEALEVRDVPALVSPFSLLPLNVAAASGGNAGMATTGTNQITNSTTGGMTVTNTPTAVPPGGAVTTTANGQLESTTQATFTSAVTGQERTAAIQKFDRSLGALTSVEIIATGEVTATAGVENLSARGGTLKTDLEATLSFRVPGLANPLTAHVEQHQQQAVARYDGTTDFGGASGRTFNVQASAGTSGTVTPGTFTRVVLTDQTSLALFSGNGTLQVVHDADADACVCGPGNIVGAVETKASGSFQVIYHYTPTSQLGSIAGFVYHDVNRNGSFGTGDLRLGRVLLSLTGTDIYGNAVTRTVRTAANGAFSFTGLTAGTYTLTETQPQGYAQGVNRAGSLGGNAVAGTDTITTINLTAGSRGTNYNFGEVRNTSPRPTTQPPPPFSKLDFITRLKWT
jgi:hypothetical protein